MMPDLVSTQDHDLLIQLHTKMDTVIAAMELIRSLENTSTRHSEKIKAIETEKLTAHNQLEKRLDKLEGKSNFLDAISLAFTAIVGTIFYFFGRH